MTGVQGSKNAAQESLRRDVYPVWREHLKGYAQDPVGDVRLLLERGLQRFMRALALWAPGFGPLDGLNASDICEAEVALRCFEVKRLEESVGLAVGEAWPPVDTAVGVAIVDYACTLKALAKWGLDHGRLRMGDLQQAMNLLAEWNSRGEPYLPICSIAGDEVADGKGDQSTAFLRCRHCPTLFPSVDGSEYCDEGRVKGMSVEMADRIFRHWRATQRKNLQRGTYQRVKRRDVMREADARGDSIHPSILSAWLSATKTSREAFYSDAVTSEERARLLAE